MSSKTVAFDFDGVIHSYTSGWQGPDVIPDPPVPGIREAIANIRAAGYKVCVFSARARYTQGQAAIMAYLVNNKIVVDAVSSEKPQAVCYIDDRAILFDGHPESLLSKIENFQPWNRITATPKYKVITLCGSTRFKDKFMEVQKDLTLQGNIVISVGCFGHSGDVFTDDQKTMLDDMHKRKIDMADEIFVINVDGYIGQSTRSEIEYAIAHNKPVNYLESSK